MIGAAETTIAGVGGTATTEREQRESTNELEKLTMSSCSQDEAADVARLHRNVDGDSLS